MDWSLLGCGRGGHVTYAPDEPALRSRLTARTHSGETWRCLRCGTFVPGPPDGSGPVASAPPVRRGKELRSALILRIFAIERFLRAVVFGAAAVGVWRFSYSRVSLQQAFNHDLPDVRRLYEDLGFNFQHSKIIGLVQHALRLNSRTLGYLALALAAYAVIEVCEGVGLWLLKRWGEYFAMVATSIFLPYEVYDLSSKVTALRVATFLVNLALVLYLVFSKRLLGVRGGKAAHEERLREGSILDQVQGEDAAVEADVPAASAGDLPDKPSSDFAERGVAQTVTDADPGSHENRPGAGAVASPQTRPGVRPQAGTAARTGTEADAASGDRPGDPANPGVTTSPGSPASPVATADAGDAGQPGR